MRLLIALAALLLAGCGTLERATGADVYTTWGVAHQLDEQSDWYVRTGREWQCEDNWQAHVGVHAEWGQWTASFNHQSWLFCGTFNSKPELYQNDIRLTRTFGRGR